MNLFVSYSRDEFKWVKELVRELRDSGLYTVWMDTSTLVGGQDWWLGILQGIEEADCVIAVLTPKSVASIYCLAELNYAYALNKPILPLTLKPKDLIFPDVITKNRTQSTDVSAFSLERTLLMCERSFNHFERQSHLNERPDPMPVRPSVPELPQQQATPEQVIETYELAETHWSEGNIDGAEMLFKQVITADPQVYGVAASERLTQLQFERQRAIDYNGIIRLMDKPMLRKGAAPLWNAYLGKYGADYDPNNYAQHFASPSIPRPPSISTPITANLADRMLKKFTPSSVPITPALNAARQRLLSVMPQRLVQIMLDWQHYNPLERAETGRLLAEIGDPRPGVGLRPDGLPDLVWCEVPGGKAKLGGDKDAYNSLAEQIVDLPTFYIAQYPITYLQFQSFLDAADGFANGLWWHGLADRQTETGDQAFKYANHPRENVSWYDAIAFCRWVSSKLGYDITLPTEQQWEKSARGTDRRFFPWGNDYETGCANIDETVTDQKVGDYYLQMTTAVGLYPQGKSPYEVMDLSGNVWEWMLTEFENNSSNKLSNNSIRVLRGGSWNLIHRSARAADRYRFAPSARDFNIGFRVVCLRPY